MRHSCSSSSSGLAEDAVGDRDLADVVQPASEPAAQDHVVGQAEPARDRARQLGDLLGVLLGHALAHARRERERLREADRLRLLRGEIVGGQLAEQPDAVAPLALGRIERAVGLVDDQLVRPGRIGQHGADRDGHVEPPLPDCDGHLADALAQRLADAPERALVLERRGQRR